MTEMRGNHDVKVAVYKVECCEKQSKKLYYYFAGMM